MNKYLPSSPFPMSDFYRTVRLAAEYVMETVQAPDALIASSFLTAMSVACQADVDVELPTEQRAPYGRRAHYIRPANFLCQNCYVNHTRGFSTVLLAGIEREF